MDLFSEFTTTNRAFCACMHVPVCDTQWNCNGEANSSDNIVGVECSHCAGENEVVKSQISNRLFSNRELSHLYM